MPLLSSSIVSLPYFSFDPLIDFFSFPISPIASGIYIIISNKTYCLTCYLLATNSPLFGRNYYQPSNVQAPVASTFVLNLQIGFGDRLEGLIVGRPHPITIYDLQIELQQRFSISVMEQNVSYNGIPLTQYPPETTLDTIGIVNNSFISLWYRNSGQQQQQPPQEYYQPRQQQQQPPPPPSSYYPEEPQSPRGGGMDPSQR